MVKRTLVVNLFGGPGAGKAQSLRSKVLTNRGWKLMGQLMIGDSVVTPSGRLSPITHIHPQGIKPLYRITCHDGSSTLACEDHLWGSYCVPNMQSRKGVYAVRSTAELKTYITKKNKRKVLKLNVSIPTIDSDHLNHCDPEPHIIEPYVLGALLGDGSLISGNPTITSQDPDIITQISTLLHPDYSVKQYGPIAFGISKKQRNSLISNIYTDELSRMGLFGVKSHEKFIPAEYKRGSKHQLLAILQGLLDTDGTVTARGGCSFSSTSKQLATDVQEMLWGFGCSASIKTRTPFYVDKTGNKVAGKISYDVLFNHSNKQQFFLLQRKKERCNILTPTPEMLRRRIKSIEYECDDNAQCITIADPEGLYITDDYMVTHNSTLAAGVFFELKIRGILSELIPEFAKEKVWEENFKAFDNQLYIFAQQHKRIFRCLGKVDVIVVDSPLLLPIIYGKNVKNEHFNGLVLQEFNSMRNLNIVIERGSFQFEVEGRMQDKDAAIQIDREVKQLLHMYKIKHCVMDVESNDSTHKTIADKIEAILNETK